MISVIIPTYNRPSLLIDRAIPSVLDQTYTNWECHVVGDGTDEETVERMGWLCRQDDRFRFTNLPRYKYPDDHLKAWGLYGLAALNHGLDTAKGDWIAVLGDDDEFLPNHHEILLREALRSGADHVYGRSMTYKSNMATGQTYGAWPPGDGQFCNGANLYRADLNYRYDLRCGERNLTGDADLWLRMVAGGVSFAFVNLFVHKYHRNFP